MKIEESVEYMSKMYLERIIKSFTQDYPSNRDEEEYREIVKSNADTLSNPENISKRIEKYIADNYNDPYANKLLYNFIIRSILSKLNFYSTEEDIRSAVINRENEIVELSKNSDSFRHIDDDTVNTFSVVLKTALEDERISNDELALITRLRKNLSITEKDQYLIQAKIGLFPNEKKEVHTSTEISRGINDLQKAGIIFYCNNYDDGEARICVIPDEIVSGVKSFLGIELIEDKYQRLLQQLQNKQLKEILRSSNLYIYGTKDELIERIIHADIKPSEALEHLTTTELSDICSKIPSLNVSGRKDEKIQRLIDYYSKLVIKEYSEENTGQKYYEYLEELAKRDIDSLLANKIVKDHDFIDNAFEEGTRYLFKNKLNIPLIEFSGNEHADGGVVFEKDKSILLWDNKSKKMEKLINFQIVI
ncbi:SAP domain-containing protein [Halalkalibaculum sp. DA3122]|uniref:SAP domain-containing protein n=1 Tax=Halalkalibaculum sp. DA3122 TaxID=3373607 RepID=UPI00375521FD